MVRHLQLPRLAKLQELFGTSEGGEVQELPKEVRQFNEAIGLPIHPSTGLPHALTSYQMTVLTYKGKDLLVVKANKIGITESVLRDMAYRGVVGDCVGYQMFLGAQDQVLAKENLKRLTTLFDDSPLLRPLIKRKMQTRLDLWNNTEYIVMPRSAQARRGWPRLKYAFLDEAAHYGLLDDEPFLAATTSRLANTNGYLRIVSTPQGQRGFFYRLADRKNDPQNPFLVKEWDYHVGVEAGLITEEFIDKERQRLGNLFPQEYELKFLASQNAAIEEDLLKRGAQDYDMEQL